MARPLRALLALFLVLLVAGCGGSGGGDEQGAVRFLVFGDPEELQAYRDLIRAYEEASGADVQLIEASDRQDLLARLSTSFAAGDPPDTFLINYRFYGQFAAKGVLEPLESRVAGSDAFELDDFYPQAVDAFRWRDEVTCLPQNISSLVVYYNRSLFERYGVQLPRAGWSLGEMVSRAAQLTRDENGQPIRAADPTAAPATAVRPAVFGLGIEPTMIRLAPFVWSNGGRLVDDERRPTRLTLETPASVVALQQFLDLRFRLGVTPSDQDREAEDDEARFANGRMAMLLSSRRSTPTFRTITGFEWDVAPLPVLQQPAGILHSDAYCMSAASERKESTWRFIEYALGREGQRVVARTGRTVPSLIEVSRSPDFLRPDEPPRNARVFLDGIPNIRRVPTVSTWPEIEDAAEPILERGLELGVPATEVARQLDEATRPLFARAEYP